MRWTPTIQTLMDEETEKMLEEFERTDRIMGAFLCIAALVAAACVALLVL